MKETTIAKVTALLEKSPTKFFTVEEIGNQLGINKGVDFKQLVQSIAMMERDQLIVFTKKGKIRLKKTTLSVEGIFRRNERGFGFVTSDSLEDDVYIAKEHTGFALNGDTVQVTLLREAEGDKRTEGKIAKVLTRSLTRVVGEFIPFTPSECQARGLYGYIVPQDKKMQQYKVMIAAEGIQPIAGSICVVEIRHYPDADYPMTIEGIVCQTLGHKNEPGMDILKIVAQYDIPTTFPTDVLAEAEAIPNKIQSEDYAGRTDLRDKTIVTIDGADAKDLDDAVSLEKLSNGHYLLGVHIADVSYYVTEGSALDREAYARGTSVYLTDRVIPMLPQRLSNGICSLNPAVPRLTLTCEMEINNQGQVVRQSIYPSVIQTTARLTYLNVNQLLEPDGATNTAIENQDLRPLLMEMASLHFILEEMRQKRGAISFEDREAGIIVDEAGHPLDIVVRTRGVAERMIESFMLVANETVAKVYQQQKYPFLYRIHEQPKEEKMQRFFEMATNFGIFIRGTRENVTPKALQEALAEVRDKPAEAVVNMMLLRSMQQARYADFSDGHYGLAAEYYTHFTSPIRRYPDLIVHRLIRSYQEQPVKQNIKEKWEQRLPDIATHSSQMERRSVEAERETDSLKKAEFMQDKLGEEYMGVISSITKFGIFVELDNTIEGLVHVSKLTDDYYHYIESHLALVGERTGVTYKIGQVVRIKVEKADPTTREIDFSIVSAEPVPSEAAFLKGTGKKQQREKKKSSNDRVKARRANSNQSANKNRQATKKKATKKPFYQEIIKQKKKRKKKKF